jgi:hypothetical protein
VSRDFDFATWAQDVVGNYARRQLYAMAVPAIVKALVELDDEPEMRRYGRRELRRYGRRLARCDQTDRALTALNGPEGPPRRDHQCPQ